MIFKFQYKEIGKNCAQNGLPLSFVNKEVNYWAYKEYRTMYSVKIISKVLILPAFIIKVSITAYHILKGIITFPISLLNKKILIKRDLFTVIRDFQGTLGIIFSIFNSKFGDNLLNLSAAHILYYNSYCDYKSPTIRVSNFPRNNPPRQDSQTNSRSRINPSQSRTSSNYTFGNARRDFNNFTSNPFNPNPNSHSSFKPGFTYQSFPEDSSYFNYSNTNVNWTDFFNKPFPSSQNSNKASSTNRPNRKKESPRTQKRNSSPKQTHYSQNSSTFGSGYDYFNRTNTQQPIPSKNAPPEEPWVCPDDLKDLKDPIANTIKLILETSYKKSYLRNEITGKYKKEDSKAVLTTMLAIPKNSSDEDIKSKYKKTAKVLHPDRCKLKTESSEEAFKILSSMYSEYFENSCTLEK